MRYIFNNIRLKDIQELQDKNTLYTCDFRAISENMEYNIPEMYKYENLAPWLTKNKLTVVNTDYNKIEYLDKNNFLVVKKGADPKHSIYSKLKISLPKNIDKLWVAIPHPDADEFSQKKNLKINYKYKDFLVANNKISQKIQLKNKTPKWELITTEKALTDILSRFKEGYLKREEGSGGYTVFKISELNKTPNFRRLFEQKGRWYFEEEVKGQPCSIQCIKEGDLITIFGFTKQLVYEGKYYYGSKILPLSNIKEQTKKDLLQGLKNLEPLLSTYRGFFGIDFMLKKDETARILEANVRLTAATIPTLLTNEIGYQHSVYNEDSKKSDGDRGVVALTVGEGNLKDTLELSPTKASIGKYVFMDLGGCKNITKSIDQDQLLHLENLVNKHVSTSIYKCHHNFWPFGWTLLFILKDSHLAISSWYLENRVLVDVFSCKHFDYKVFHGVLKKYFKASKVGKIIIKNR